MSVVKIENGISIMAEGDNQSIIFETGHSCGKACNSIGFDYRNLRSVLTRPDVRRLHAFLGKAIAKWEAES